MAKCNQLLALKSIWKSFYCWRDNNGCCLLSGGVSEN